MDKLTPAVVQEACAIVGVGLFAVGLWLIYPPASLLFTGLILTTPFLLAIKRGSP